MYNIALDGGQVKEDVTVRAHSKHQINAYKILVRKAEGKKPLR